MIKAVIRKVTNIKEVKENKSNANDKYELFIKGVCNSVSCGVYSAGKASINYLTKIAKLIWRADEVTVDENNIIRKRFVAYRDVYEDGNPGELRDIKILNNCQVRIIEAENEDIAYDLLITRECQSKNFLEYVNNRKNKNGLIYDRFCPEYGDESFMKDINDFFKDSIYNEKGEKIISIQPDWAEIFFKFAKKGKNEKSEDIKLPFEMIKFIYEYFYEWKIYEVTEDKIKQKIEITY